MSLFHVAVVFDACTSKKNKETFCGAKIAENVRIGPAGQVEQVKCGAKSAEITLFSPAGYVNK